MKCRHCGTKLSENSKQCTFCGAHFDNEAALGYKTKKPVDVVKRAGRFEKFFKIWANIVATVVLISLISMAILSTIMGNETYIFIAVGITAFLGLITVGFVFIMFKLNTAKYMAQYKDRNKNDNKKL